ncbi:exo-alpha-sialidase, partial [Trypanosoma cruzi]
YTTVLDANLGLPRLPIVYAAPHYRINEGVVIGCVVAGVCDGNHHPIHINKGGEAERVDNSLSDFAVLFKWHRRILPLKQFNSARFGCQGMSRHIGAKIQREKQNKHVKEQSGNSFHLDA